MTYVEGKRKRGPSLEEVARLVLQKRAAPERSTQELSSMRISLPRVRFLEAPLPAWWGEDFARRPVLRDPKWQPPL